MIGGYFVRYCNYTQGEFFYYRFGVFKYIIGFFFLAVPTSLQIHEKEPVLIVSHPFHKNSDFQLHDEISSRS